MIKRDVIVIGASAGGVKALTAIVGGLPRDLSASVFVVLHVSPHKPSTLPTILGRAGPLEVVHAQDGEVVRNGKIYVAPPDRHLLLETDKIAVRRGPKENRFRPSVDALFRSAADVYGSRAIGVILSGLLDDGTSGLRSIKRLGGIGIVQKPEDARYPQMPRNALDNVEIEHVCRATEIGALLAKLVGETSPLQSNDGDC